MHEKWIPFSGQNAANRETGKKRGKRTRVARPSCADNSAWGRCNSARRIAWVTVSWVNAPSLVRVVRRDLASRILIGRRGFIVRDSRVFVAKSSFHYRIVPRLDSRVDLAIGMFRDIRSASQIDSCFATRLSIIYISIFLRHMLSCMRHIIILFY